MGLTAMKAKDFRSYFVKSVDSDIELVYNELCKRNYLSLSERQFASRIAFYKHVAFKLKLPLFSLNN